MAALVAVIYLHQNSIGFSVQKAGDALNFHYDGATTQLERQRRTQRELGIGAQILHDLNLRRVRLLTNHPRRLPALDGYGIEIVEHVAIVEEQRTDCRVAGAED